ncbi:MAG TPA: hypothetical protein VJ792_08430 [Candidatus Nitrosotalea sp.]|nr:hypothetical protein [Candidatus Nitrosotalea sp.]
MDYPVTIENGEIKIKAEKMEVDKLYYCLYKEKVMLFFKDKNDLLNCYEIEEKEIVDEVKMSEQADIDKILEKFIEKKNLNPKPGGHSH